MKRERRKILPTRKREALRRVFIAAAALFLLNRVFLLGLLFPIQAIRHNEERMGTGRTAVVCRDWARELGWTYGTYLTENEHVVMLSGAHLTYLGWMDDSGAAVDCMEEGPLHGGWWSLGREGRPNLYYVFGRIDDPDIDFLKIQVRYEDWTSGEAVRRTAFEWGISREEWKEKDGQFYFLVRKSPVNWSDYPSMLYPLAIGYDEAGKEIAREELDQYAGTHSG